MAEYSVTHTVRWSAGDVSDTIATEYTIDAQDSYAVLDLEQLRLKTLGELRKPSPGKGKPPGNPAGSGNSRNRAFHGSVPDTKALIDFTEGPGPGPAPP